MATSSEEGGAAAGAEEGSRQPVGEREPRPLARRRGCGRHPEGGSSGRQLEGGTVAAGLREGAVAASMEEGLWSTGKKVCGCR
jgi:hypothetical protein